MNHAGVVDLKKSCLPRLCLDTLSSEHVVFSKMLYRAKNQHRHDKSFQRMTGVSRKLKKYLMVNLSAKVKALINQLYSVKRTVGSIPPDTVAVIEEMFLQLSEAATFSADLLSFTEDTWREVNLRLVRGLFIPFNTIMLASLSRIWFCLRFHLLGIAETYAVLKNTAPQAKPPVLHVVSHLKQCHRAYLDVPPLHHLHPVASPSENRHETDTDVAIQDTGVVIELTEHELQARMRDFGLPVHPPPGPVPSEIAPQPTQSVCESSVVGESFPSAHTLGRGARNKKNRKRSLRWRRVKNPSQRISSTNLPQATLSISDVSTARKESGDDSSQVIETKTPDPRKKRKKCRHKNTRGRQKASLPVSGNFRQYIVKQSGRQKMIIGSKVWAEKRKKKQALKRHLKAVTDAKTAAPLQFASTSSAYSGTSPLASNSGTSLLADDGIRGGQGGVHHMQALFQDRATQPTVAAENVKVSDDIDQIFSNLQ